MAKPHLSGLRVDSDSSLELSETADMFLSPISAFPRSKGGCLSDKIVSPKSEHLTPQQLLRLYSNISEVDTDVSSSLAVDDLITNEKLYELDEILYKLNEDFLGGVKDPVLSKFSSKDDQYVELVSRRRHKRLMFLQNRSISMETPTQVGLLEEADKKEAILSLQTSTSQEADITVPTLYDAMENTRQSYSSHDNHMTSGSSKKKASNGYYDGSPQSYSSEHSICSSLSGTVFLEGGEKMWNPAGDMLMSMFCDFESPLLIPDYLIPEHIPQAKPSLMAMESLVDSPTVPVPRAPLPFDLDDDKSVHEEEEEDEAARDMPSGTSATNFAITGRPGTTKPIPFSSLPDLPYFPYVKGQPLETVLEETASQLSPLVSPRESPKPSVSSPDIDPRSSSVHLCPPQHRLPVQTNPSAQPSREGCRHSMESLLSTQSADTIYFSITSYDDEVQGEPTPRPDLTAEETKPTQPPSSPRTRKKGINHNPNLSLLKWLSQQPSEGDLETQEQIWPFNELSTLRQEATTRRIQNNQPDLSVCQLTEEQVQVDGLSPSFLSIPPPAWSESSGSVASCRVEVNDDLASRKFDDLSEAHSSTESEPSPNEKCDAPEVPSAVHHRMSDASTLISGSGGLSIAESQRTLSEAETFIGRPLFELDNIEMNYLPIPKERSSLDHSLSIRTHLMNLKKTPMLLHSPKAEDETLLSPTIHLDEGCSEEKPNFGGPSLDGKMEATKSTSCSTQEEVQDKGSKEKVSPQNTFSLTEKEVFAKDTSCSFKSPTSDSLTGSAYHGSNVLSTPRPQNQDADHHQLDATDSTAFLDQLTQAHSIEVTELNHQIEQYRQDLKISRDKADKRIASLSQERDSAQSRLKDIQKDHKVEINQLEIRLTKDNNNALYEMKARIVKEKEEELNKVKDKFSQEMADIKRFLQEKDRELTLARSIAKERDIAALALSEELVEHRREFREKERKLKEQLIEEAKRAEKQLTREKKVAFTKAEEIANTQKQKELLELKEKLIEEKHAALSGAKQKHSTQAKELEQKLQNSDLELKKTKKNLVDMEKQFSQEKEEILKASNEKLASTVSSLKLSLEKEFKDAATKEKAAYQQEQAALQRSLKTQLEQEKETVNSLKQQLQEIRHGLELEKSKVKTLQAEKQAAILSAKEQATAAMKEEISLIKQQLSVEHKVEVDKLNNKVHKLEGEITKRKSEELRLQEHEKDFLRSIEEEDKLFLKEVTNEFHLVSMALGKRQTKLSQPTSKKGETLRQTALIIAKQLLLELREQVSELKRQAETERQMASNAQREKVAALRKLRAELQIEKSKALKEQEARLSKDTPAGQAATSLTPNSVKENGSQTNTPNDSQIVIRQLQIALKSQEKQIERQKSALVERAKEYTQLQNQLKQLNKEHLLLQRERAGK